MSQFPFIFPRTIFVDQNGICGQVAHIAAEAAEAAAETSNPDVFALAVEIMDGLHSSETGLRILEEKYGVDLNAVRDAVIRKNQPRGYYGSTFCPSECQWLSPTEEEQNLQSIKAPHRCGKYGKLLHHFNGHPNIHRTSCCTEP